jgi:hypothetical protein
MVSWNTSPNLRPRPLSGVRSSCATFATRSLRSASIRCNDAPCGQFWSAEWTPPAPGEYTLLVRAVDGAGAVQPGRWRRLPDGAEGYHEVRIRVPG